MGRQEQEDRKLNRKSKNWSKSGLGSRLAGGGRVFSKDKLQLQAERDKLDARFGFERYEEPGKKRLGWLLNMQPTALPDADGRERSGLDLYFLEKNSRSFKVTLFYEPYFYIGVIERFAADVMALCQRKLEEFLFKISIVDKEDLDLPNHLSGKKANYLRLSFRNVADLMEAKKIMLPVVTKNQARVQALDTCLDDKDELPEDFLDTIHDIREYDVPYYVRVSIDKDIRVGAWYTIEVDTGNVVVERQVDMIDKGEPRVLAFDIECTKQPLKFPDAANDQIYMISYMIDGQGYLIVSRKIVSKDIDDFEYTPKADYPGPFKIFNEPDELSLIRRFFDHVQEIKPHIFVTYNGDFFDWPFLEERAKKYKINMGNEIGIYGTKQGEYRGSCAVHMDAFCWVKRDSYLPQGSQGLKAVTKYKLGYDPVEIDPEDMVDQAVKAPSVMATYSVSDAVATYYLYDKYVHLFVFSLCTIIPMGAEDVLRKGSGTLCEALLMVEAFRDNIICPNKEKSATEKYHKGHLVESETYIGGHVECLESGVFRSDIEYEFDVTPSAFDQLIKNVDRDLTFALEVELDVQRSEVLNYDQVRCEIIQQLEMIRDAPKRKEKPFIYHLDVAAMYPNIILTNRLQPCAIVDEATCASCVHNSPESQCQRKMQWVWRGDYYPAKRHEYEHLKMQLEYETINGKEFKELPKADQAAETKKRLKKYCSSVYRRVKLTEEVERTNTVCMRENPFYVNTVRAFRDRRYEYKILTKKWKGKQKEASKQNDTAGMTDAKNKALVFDSLQLAHKCILNSFYGYVMRKGARWHSMEMAGIVTNTGSSLITRARILVEQIGRPLELDTDGIWCILPKSFPANFSFELANGKKCKISYPCVMLNADVHELYTNHQYQEQVPKSMRYQQRDECSIFFELDGPYRCMVIPASTEEGKLLKKRYAVFNFDGSLAELKGFELKRRGELQLIKTFQSEIFDHFLEGRTLAECYDSVADCANHYLDIIDTKGVDIDDEELMELITENRNMSRSLEDYGQQKSTSITTAKRLGEFLGEDTVKDKGLNCKMVIAKRPVGTTVTERAIPIAIFSTEEAQMKHYLRKWLKDPGMTDFNIRNILDWDYYKTRLAGTIQKIISIPAAFQDVSNPIPRIPLPPWMERRFREKHNKFQQTSIDSLFQKADKLQLSKQVVELVEIEDIGSKPREPRQAPVPVVHRYKSAMEVEPEVECDQDMDDAVDRSEDYGAWLSNRKSRWKKLRRERKRRKEEMSSENSKRRRGGGMDDFVSKATATITSNHTRFLYGPKDVEKDVYELLEIQELHESGIFQLWTLASHLNQLIPIQIKIGKSFYLNCIEEPEQPYGRRVVNRVLPHGQAQHYLYHMSMSLRQFHENTKELKMLLSDPNISAAYEMNVSPLMQILQELGCCFTFRNEVVKQKGFSLKKTFALEDLEPRSTGPLLALNSRKQNKRYLKQHERRLQRILLYFATNKKVGIIAVFFLTSTRKDEQDDAGAEFRAAGQIFLIDPYSRTQHKDEHLPNIQALFQSLNPSPNSSCRCEIKVVKTVEEACSGVNEILSHKQTSSSIILAQSSLSKRRLREKMTGLHAYPVCTLPFHKADSVFPALTWKNDVVKRALARAVEMNEYWRELVDCSQYTDIPVGNFETDHSIAIYDTIYARMLRRNNHVLWASLTNKPDLGGMETIDLSTNVLAPVLENAEASTLTRPGSYRDVCVQFSVTGLAIASMLVASELYHLDVGSHGTLDMDVLCTKETPTNSNQSHALAATKGTNLCDEAFKHLQSLVVGIFQDFIGSKNKYAEHLLNHFYRYISSSSSQLYDPALHQMVHTLMHNLFEKLLLEFRRLGATLIYADFGKIIICTKKKTVKGAQTYTKFLMDTIMANPLFQVLVLEPQEYWSNLLFMDIENYGAVQLYAESRNVSDKENAGGYSSILSHWNIANYLPDGVSDFFLLIVGQFIKRQLDFAQKCASRSAKFPDGKADEAIDKHAQHLITSHFSDRLYEIVPEINDSAITDVDFPELPGSHLKLTNPALEYVKFVCAVLSLETVCKYEVQSLRRGLLKLLNFSEFEEKTKFVNPSVSIVVRDVICAYCHDIRNLDLCRDPDVMNIESEEPWRCSRCQTAYDMAAIEMQLVQYVEERSLKYQLQDLQCKKCMLPQDEVMRQYCPCSGKYIETERPEEFEETLKILHKLAGIHRFEWLAETTQVLLSI